MASLRKTSSVVGGLAIGLATMGIAGVAAMTALAIKSPVLAGTMAKIELATFKLSNTIARQLKPIFEEIAGSLLPAINQAFSDNSEFIEDMVDGVTILVEALGDLIKLDWEGLLGHLDELFIDRAKLDVEGGPFKETKQIAKEIKFLYGEGAEAVTRYAEEKPGRAALGFAGQFMNLGYHAIIDTLQWIIQGNNDKEKTYAMATGITR